MDKENRLYKANVFLDTIKSCGIELFKDNNGFEAKLEIYPNENIYYTDANSKKTILVEHKHLSSPQFSYGDGLNSFVRDFTLKN